MKVIAKVPPNSIHKGATASHALTIPRFPANLTFTAPPRGLLIRQSTLFVADQDGDGEIIWSIVEEGAAATISPTTGLVTAGTTTETITVQAVVATTDTHATETITTTLEITGQVDVDGDGLIEIYDSTMLHNMRYNLAGTSYKTTSDATGATTGCPLSACIGYELANDLDLGSVTRWQPIGDCGQHGNRDTTRCGNHQTAMTDPSPPPLRATAL